VAADLAVQAVTVVVRWDEVQSLWETRSRIKSSPSPCLVFGGGSLRDQIPN
jgi:hypothetical protein